MKTKLWMVYILECADGTYYTGCTNDLTKRLSAHSKGVGSKYTRGRLPITLVYRESAANRSVALRREAAIKKLSRLGKRRLVRWLTGFST